MDERREVDGRSVSGVSLWRMLSTLDLRVESSVAETGHVIDFACTKSSLRDCDYSSSSLHPPWCRELLVPVSDETAKDANPRIEIRCHIACRS